MRTCVFLVLVASVAFGGAVVGPPGGGVPDSPGAWYSQIGKGVADIGKASVRYVRNRLLDLLDIAEVNIGVGPGAKAGVEYAIGRTTLGYVESTRLGLDSRQVGVWSERNVSYGIFPLSLVFLPFELTRGLGETWETIAVVGFELGTIGIERWERENFNTTAKLYEVALAGGPIHERPGDIAAIGAELHLFFGARARVKPLEIVDFALGFIGIDLDPQLRHPNPVGGPAGKRHPWKPLRRR
jgi:hypothetical protein